MLKGSEFEFLLHEKHLLSGEPGNIALQTALDRHYYSSVWKALKALPQADRRVSEKIISQEISLRNSGWALRLRRYYGMNAEEVKRYLLEIPRKGSRVKAQSLAADAIRSLEYPLDNYAAWSSWRWKEFLNPDTGGGFWHADPRHFQNAASLYLFGLARHNFRLKPSSLDTIFCFIKIKQFEEDILTSEAEGLGMGLSSSEVLDMLGLKQ
jgi:vacuolar-type H+-ATPase subunit C/Vma6